MKNALELLCETIAYPDPVPADAKEFALRVDGAMVFARLIGTRLVFSYGLSRRSEDLPKLASIAAGRLLKEEAVLAWDEKAGECILWQECPADAVAAQLKHCFEEFLTSCDWWQARVIPNESAPVSYPEMVIIP